MGWKIFSDQGVKTFIASMMCCRPDVKCITMLGRDSDDWKRNFWVLSVPSFRNKLIASTKFTKLSISIGTYYPVYPQLCPNSHTRSKLSILMFFGNLIYRWNWYCDIKTPGCYPNIFNRAFNIKSRRDLNSNVSDSFIIRTRSSTWWCRLSCQVTFFMNLTAFSTLFPWSV